MKWSNLYIDSLTIVKHAQVNEVILLYSDLYTTYFIQLEFIVNYSKSAHRARTTYRTHPLSDRSACFCAKYTSLNGGSPRTIPLAMREARRRDTKANRNEVRVCTFAHKEVHRGQTDKDL